jgi:hypothetical protein
VPASARRGHALAILPIFSISEDIKFPRSLGPAPYKRCSIPARRHIDGI